MASISFMSANYVAKVLGYRMTEGWRQGDLATNEYFEPLETFARRFDELLVAVRSMGFESVDIWTAHLNWAWATEAHIAHARTLLDRHNLRVTSLAGAFGTTEAEFDAACRLAVALGTTVLGGGAPILESNRDAVIAALRRHGVKLGIENHPGLLTPEEVLTRIGTGEQGLIGATIDTGWFGTAGVNAAAAIEQLGSHIFHVHLKDVLTPNNHVTCRYGRGCVPIEACTRALTRIGYRGDISVEHEPDDFDPVEDCAANLAMLRTWLVQA